MEGTASGHNSFHGKPFSPRHNSLSSHRLTQRSQTPIYCDMYGREYAQRLDTPRLTYITENTIHCDVFPPKHALETPRMAYITESVFHSDLPSRHSLTPQRTNHINEKQILNSVEVPVSTGSKHFSQRSSIQQSQSQRIHSDISGKQFSSNHILQQVPRVLHGVAEKHIPNEIPSKYFHVTPTSSGSLRSTSHIGKSLLTTIYPANTFRR